TDRQLHARGDQRRQRSLQHREARLDERAIHREDAGGGARRRRAAVLRRGWSWLASSGRGATGVSQVARVASSAREAVDGVRRTGASAADRGRRVRAGGGGEASVITRSRRS